MWKKFRRPNIFFKFRKFSKRARFLIGPKIDLTKKENYCYRLVRLNLAIPTLISLIFWTIILEDNCVTDIGKCHFSRKLRHFAINRVAEILRLFHKDSFRQGAHITCQKRSEALNQTWSRKKHFGEKLRSWCDTTGVKKFWHFCGFVRLNWLTLYISLTYIWAGRDYDIIWIVQFRS